MLNKQKTSEVKNCDFDFILKLENPQYKEELGLSLQSIDFFQRRKYIWPFHKTDHKIVTQYLILGKKSIEVMNSIIPNNEYDANLRIHKQSKGSIESILLKTFRVKIERVYLNEHFSYDCKHPMHFYVEMLIL